MSTENSGIYIEGSSVIAGAMAAGPSAQAHGDINGIVTSVPTSLAELRAALDTVAERLQTAQVQVDDQEAACSLATAAQQEAAKSEPSKHVLRGLLQGLMTGAGRSAELANAVVAIQHAISALL